MKKLNCILIFCYTKEMTSNPECLECGGKEYVLENGYYYCAECQVQSQDMRQVVTNEEDFGGLYHSKVHKATSSIGSKFSEEHSKEAITSWELLNYCLVGLIDELINLGVDKEIKIIALQLWVSYLQKLEIAFISMHIPCKPRLGVSFSVKDAKLLYGVSNEVIKACKNPLAVPKSKAGSSSVQSVSDETSTFLSRKIVLSKKKKKLAEAEYLSQTSNSSLNSMTSSKSQTLKYSKKAKTSLVKVLKKAKKENSVGKRSVLLRQLKSRYEVVNYTLTKKSLLSIIRLALLLNHSDVHLSDLFRWCEDGCFSLNNLPKFTPKEFFVSENYHKLITISLASRYVSNKSLVSLIKLIGCNQSEIKPNFLNLCKRYCQELNLPYEIISVIEKLLKLHPQNLPLNTLVNYEGRAMALIIFVLKLLFVLDDFTELEISKFADTVNSVSQTKCTLFSWNEWSKWLIFRNSVICMYHQSSRDRWYPNSRVGGSDAFLTSWNRSPSEFLSESKKKSFKINEKISSSIRHSLRCLSSNVGYARQSTLNHFYDLTQELIANDDMDEMLKNELNKNFEKHSVCWLYSDSALMEILKNVEISAKIRTKRLITEFVFVEQEKENKNFKSSKNILAEVETDECKKDSDEGERSCNAKKIKNVANRVCQEPEKNQNNDGLYIYRSYNEYWIYHGNFDKAAISETEAEELLIKMLPSSFFWLIKECCRIIGQNIREFYMQYVLVEKIFINCGKKNKKNHSLSSVVLNRW